MMMFPQKGKIAYKRLSQPYIFLTGHRNEWERNINKKSETSYLSY